LPFTRELWPESSFSRVTSDEGSGGYQPNNPLRIIRRDLKSPATVESQPTQPRLFDRASCTRIAADLGGRELTPPDEIIRRMRLDRDEQLMDLR
jgi:hypothetical protein